MGSTDYLTEAEKELLAYLRRNYHLRVGDDIICLAYHGMRGDIDRLEAWLIAEGMVSSLGGRARWGGKV